MGTCSMSAQSDTIPPLVFDGDKISFRGEIFLQRKELKALDPRGKELNQELQKKRKEKKTRKEAGIKAITEMPHQAVS